jgi:uncharacterized protein (TIGR03067 family)
MRLALVCAFLAASAVSAVADDAPRDDLAKLQGKWSAKVGQEKDIPLTLEIKDRTANLLITIQGQPRSLQGEFTLDEAKTPKQWDWKKFKNAEGQDVPDNLSIYKIDGDTLTLCSGGPGNDRPSDFKAGQDGPPILIDFTRAKAEVKKEDAEPKPGEKK